MKKILAISMKTGWGHIRAAQALEEYAAANLPDIKINHVDLREIEPRLGKFFEIFYDITNEHLPAVWGAVYQTFDMEPVSLAFRKAGGFQRLFRRRILAYLKRQSPDGVIFTNVIPAPMIAPPCRKIFPNIKMAVVVTDYHGHSYYNVPLVDKYFVAIPEVKNDLARAGVDEQKIAVSGIPVGRRFYENYDQKKLKNKIGFKNNFKTVLFVSRMNKDFVATALEGLLAADPPLNLIMVCGGNNELYKKIKAAILPRKNFKLLNWTNRLDEYMKTADLVVSKPGGLIISECLALGKKIVMADPIPGQEERNAEFMAQYGYGKFAPDAGQIVAMAVDLLANPQNEILPARANASALILDYFK